MRGVLALSRRFDRGAETDAHVQKWLFGGGVGGGGSQELRSCVKVEVAVSNEPTISVDVKQHFNGGSRRGRLPGGWGRLGGWGGGEAFGEWAWGGGGGGW